MRPSEIPKHLRWSNAGLALTTLFLTFIVFIALWFIKTRGLPIKTEGETPSAPGVGDFADLLSVIAIVVSLMLPSLWMWSSRLIDWMRPRPGANAFNDNLLNELGKSFEIDRRTLRIATVPEHYAKAEPAKTSRSLSFGDAHLVIPERQLSKLSEFIGKSKSAPNSIKSTKELEKEILIVTGEPGAGKSVLIQEIHQTLTSGIEMGYHSFVPLVILAREITLPNLEKALRDSEKSMRAFLSSYYENRIKTNPIDEDLKFLFNLIVHDWESSDFLVIIDGLDEIAQRSSYELIQRNLAQVILQDLKFNQLSTHRYILSCRVDEDLELFHDAENLFIRGLNDNEREKFCRALLGEINLNKQSKRQIGDALNSPRLTPSHVFRRNPYFLALLLRHLREDEERVRDQIIDFDFLMRKYLEREAIRPYASAQDQKYVDLEERRNLFSELEKVSRACLQYLAFSSASTARIGALYDEVPIESNLIDGFFESVKNAGGDDGNNIWKTLNLFMEHLVEVENNQNISAETVQKFGFNKHLHENDIRLFETLGKRLKNGESVNDLLLDALGTIPYKGIIETEEWYKQFLAGIKTATNNAESSMLNQLVTLLFVRSVAAAQLLRILIISVTPNGVSIRFRHRRLAEYYAAGYLRDMWANVKDKLDFTPWLSPVLNLTCALEGPQCRVLKQLVERVRVIDNPYFKWRYSMESAVEAAFFSEPGNAYDEAIKDLLEINIEFLFCYGSALNQGQLNGYDDRKLVNSLDPVTEISILRAIRQFARLKDSTKVKSILSDRAAQQFYLYERDIPSQWMAPVIPASLAVQVFLGKKTTLWGKLNNFWMLLQQPRIMFLSEFGAFSDKFQLTRICIIGLVFLSDFIILLLLTCLLVVPFYLATKILGFDNQSNLQYAGIAAAIVFLSLGARRLIAWQQSPTAASSRGAVLWRAITAIYRILAGKMKIQWRAVGQWLFTVPKVLFSVFATSCIIFGIIFIPRALNANSDSATTPCPEIDQIQNSLIAKYNEVLKNVNKKPWSEIQRELREDVAKFREANSWRRCGYKSDYGWVVAEDRLVDSFSTFDPRLIPLPSQDASLPLRSEECMQMQEFSAFPIFEPQPGLGGAFEAIFYSWEYRSNISGLTDIRSRILKARREGLGLPDENQCPLPAFAIDTKKIFSSDEEKKEIKAANILVTEIEKQIQQGKEISNKIYPQTQKTLLYILFAFIVLIMGFILWRAFYKSQKDKAHLMLLENEKSPKAICKILLNHKYSERVRLHALRKLDLMGVKNDDELREVENAAGGLLKSAVETEKNLGIATANLARVLSKRLRHRISTDAPLFRGKA